MTSQGPAQCLAVLLARREGLRHQAEGEECAVLEVPSSAAVEEREEGVAEFVEEWCRLCVAALERKLAKLWWKLISKSSNMSLAVRTNQTSRTPSRMPRETGRRVSQQAWRNDW